MPKIIISLFCSFVFLIGCNVPVNKQVSETTIVKTEAIKDSLISSYDFVITKVDYLNNDNILPNYSKDSIIIDFTSGFLNDSIKLFIDKKLIYNNVCITELSAGFADFLTIKKNKNIKSIGMIINNKKYVETQLDLNYNFIDIRYEKENKALILNYSHTQPIYD